MIRNKFIHPKIQKAFISKINGPIEHNQLLKETITYARVNKKTLHVRFCDLEDDFGSLSHDLIQFSMERYQFPDNVCEYVGNLYNNLQGTIVTKGWQSSPFTFQHGIFQGDPWSPIIFLTVFNPLLEKLRLESKRGYDLNGVKIITTLFVDDFILITKHRYTHQRLINDLQKWTTSMGLKLKPSKCKNLLCVVESQQQ